jgi:hypothetical protein
VTKKPGKLYVDDMAKHSVKKKMEGGYKVVWALYLLFFLTIVFTCWMNLYAVNQAKLLAEQGLYYTQPFDLSPLNWVISAEGAVVAVAAGMQSWKKKSNNNFEHIEALLDRWAEKYDIAYVTQIIQSLLMSNTNNS